MYRKAVLLFLKKEESMTLKDMHYISLIAEEKVFTKGSSQIVGRSRAEPVRAGAGAGNPGIYW